MRRCLAVAVALGLVAPLLGLVASAGGQARADGPLEISNFTIEPPFASPGGAARIRFEFRGAQGGLKSATLVARPATGPWRTSVFEAVVNQAISALGGAAEGVVVAEGRHQGGYTPAQRGTTNLYELRVTDRAGRQSNTVSASLEVRF